MSATIVNTTDDNFQADVLDAGTPVLVDFGQVGVHLVKPSHLFLKIYQVNMRVSKIVKVDVTSCEETAVKYNIRNIPALLLFKMVK